MPYRKRKKTKSPKFVSQRYLKSIKETINKMLGGRDTIHKHIAEIIRDYSHKPLLTHGTYLMSRKMQYFVIEKVLSAHFCKGFYCPSHLNREHDFFWYEPYTQHRTDSFVKKIVAPFSNHPHIKDRTPRFFLLQNKDVNGQVSPLERIIRRSPLPP